MSASPRPSAGLRRRITILLAVLGASPCCSEPARARARPEPAYDVEPPEVEVAPGNGWCVLPGSWKGAGIQFVLHVAEKRLDMGDGPRYNLT